MSDDPGGREIAEPVAGIDTPPVAEESGPIEDDRDSIPGAPRPFRWKLNVVLFIGTVLSTFLAGALYEQSVSRHADLRAILRALPTGYSFAIPLLAILLTHEFGHYIAARIHRVDASLPFFIPLPYVSQFGTMGAIIAMRGRIRSRNALLDIGASGPLAGLCVAVPVLAYGLAHSKIEPLGLHGQLEGQCLLYLGLKRIVLGVIPPGHDVTLNATALAGWVGLFLTMLNLVAVAQLDGGHIAYALFGPRQNRFAKLLHRFLLVMFAGNLVYFLAQAHKTRDDLELAFGNALPWLVWYVLIAVVMRVGGADHPPTEPGELSPVRKVIAVFSLVMFGLLFMPTPWTQF